MHDRDGRDGARQRACSVYSGWTGIDALDESMWMNKQTPQSSLHNQNGNPPAPLFDSGAGRASPQPSQLPDDFRQVTWRSIFYSAEHCEIAGVRPVRWLWGVGILLALLWLTGWLPGGYWVSGAICGGLITLTLVLHSLRRADYVTFSAEPLPEISPSALPATDRIPVHVTGALSVTGKERRFTWLPGLYCSFATREHALICQQRQRRVLGIGQWPEAQIGLWYAFIQPSALNDVQWGWLRFDGSAQRAIAIIYRPEATQKTSLRRSTPSERLLLAFANDDDARWVYADLRSDWS